MVIKRKRIINIEKYFAKIPEDKEFYICVTVNEGNIDYTKGYSDKENFVPKPIGPVTRFNLYGKEYVHTEKEKELREFERDYHVVDWHGTDHYGTCFQSRMCYPKEYIIPPLSRIHLENGTFRSDLIKKGDSELLKHTINMFLEIFGYCEIIDKDEKPIEQKTRIKEVSWRILPPGKYPWERVKQSLENYFEIAPSRNKEVLRRNHKTFAKYNPDFLAIGENSFYGYVVYGYTNRNLYVFESNQPGNATYVFKGEWEKASQLTKYDIIKGDRCYKRIIHSTAWKETVKQLFN